MIKLINWEISAWNEKVSVSGAVMVSKRLPLYEEKWKEVARRRRSSLEGLCFYFFPQVERTEKNNFEIQPILQYRYTYLPFPVCSIAFRHRASLFACFPDLSLLDNASFFRSWCFTWILKNFLAFNSMKFLLLPIWQFSFVSMLRCFVNTKWHCFLHEPDNIQSDTMALWRRVPYMAVAPFLSNQRPHRPKSTEEAKFKGNVSECAFDTKNRVLYSFTIKSKRGGLKQEKPMKEAKGFWIQGRRRSLQRGKRSIYLDTSKTIKHVLVSKWNN